MARDPCKVTQCDRCGDSFGTVMGSPPGEILEALCRRCAVILGRI